MPDIRYGYVFIRFLFPADPKTADTRIFLPAGINYGSYLRREQDTPAASTEWMLSSILHRSMHFGNTGLVPHDLQGLSTR